ncbi:MAG: hypothetical protein H6564_16530 [Lewinellaceae bacterium]|nr:hypothetical protein [Lewinellaceae bacterium]
MAIGSQVPVAERSSAGSLSNLSTAEISSGFTTLTITESDDTEHTYSIPLNGALAFELVEEDIGGGEKQLVLEEVAEFSTDILAIKLDASQDMAFTLTLDKVSDAQGEHLQLEFVGELDEDVCKPIVRATILLGEGALLAFRRTADNFFLRIQAPSN